MPWPAAGLAAKSTSSGGSAPSGSPARQRCHRMIGRLVLAMTGPIGRAVARTMSTSHDVRQICLPGWSPPQWLRPRRIASPNGATDPHACLPPIERENKRGDEMDTCERVHRSARDVHQLHPQPVLGAQPHPGADRSERRADPAQRRRGRPDPHGRSLRRGRSATRP